MSNIWTNILRNAVLDALYLKMLSRDELLLPADDIDDIGAVQACARPRLQLLPQPLRAVHQLHRHGVAGFQVVGQVEKASAGLVLGNLGRELVAAHEVQQAVDHLHNSRPKHKKGKQEGLDKRER